MPEAFAQPIEESMDSPLEHTPSTYDGRRDTYPGDGPNVIPPLVLYEKIKGYSYSFDYFNLKGYEELDDEADMFSVKDQIKYIEDYVQDEIKDRRLENSVNSFNDVMKEIFDTIGGMPTEKAESRLNRVYNFLQYREKNQELEAQKQALWKTYKQQSYE